MAAQNLGRLFLVATPIGNLGDMTVRAIETLKACDVIFAEDTRSALKLLRHFNIGDKPITSYFAGNEAQKNLALLEELASGKTVAMISDAGMPGISDPGQKAVDAAALAGHEVSVIPGASSVLTALVLSGLPCVPFRFVGFVPRTFGERQMLWGTLHNDSATLVMFEAPTRAKVTLQELSEAFGSERPAAMCRELTKMHEECVRAPLGQLAETFSSREVLGECVIVVQGAEPEAHDAQSADLPTLVTELLQKGLGPKDVAQRLMAQTGKSRREIYQLALSLARDLSDK